MALVPFYFRTVAMAAGASLVFLAATTSARADCQTDIVAFMKKRDAVLAQLGAMTAGGKKQLDPVVACPKFRSLVGILGETVGYLQKNKEWCTIPDQVIEGASKQRTQFSAYSAKACKMAVEFQKMKEQAEKQQQAGGVGAPQVQRLPAGPL